MHLIVQEINRKLDRLENNTSYVDMIDENGNILIQQNETFPNLEQGFLAATAAQEGMMSLREFVWPSIGTYIVLQFQKRLSNECL